MAKQSAYLKRLREQWELEERRNHVQILQMGMDVAVVALNQAFGFGPERLNKFREAYQSIWDEYANMLIRNGKDDADNDYAFEKMDRVLQRICGEYYTPRERRYDD